MSDLTVMEAMVARELWNTADDYGHPEDYIEQARTLIHSLRPIIEAEVRERIAAEIEARLAREAEAAESIGNPLAALGIRTASWDAARIARGQP